MDEIKIERGIEPPDRLGLNKYPWKEMKVGDSFLIPTGYTANPYNRASWANKRHSPKVFRGAVTKDGFRIWRIK